MQDIQYRPAESDDIKFILDSWLKSWRVSPAAGTIRNDVYFDVQRRTIEGLVARGATLLVAVSAQSGRILGWICHEISGSEAVVHYLYVKDPYVRLGIQSELLSRIPGTKPGFYTHAYRQVLEACKGWRHAPEIARRK